MDHEVYKMYFMMLRGGKIKSVMGRQMDYELYELYYQYLSYPDMRWEVGKVANGMYHIYRINPDGSRDGIPRVLKPKGVLFKSCTCCKWKPEY